MKREINLRTREFAIAREFHWPRVFLILGILALVAAVGAGSFYLHIYRLNQFQEVAFLELQKEQLTARIVPIEEMEAEIQELRRIIRVDESFTEKYIPWSSHLSRIDQIASWGLINIDAVTSTDTRTVNIRGTGPSMRRIVIFVENLDELEFLAGVRYTVMNLQQNNFSYNIDARIVGGGD